MANSPTSRERDIQKAILDYLAAERILAFRMNTGAVSASHNGRRRFFRFGTPGMADILAFPAYGTLWVEVKAAKGKQSPEQASFQKMVQDHGHYYLLARSVEDVKGDLHG